MRTFRGIVAAAIAACASGSVPSATFWTETFATTCGSGCPANFYVGANGGWSTSVTGAQGPDANLWYVSRSEPYPVSGAGSCGTPSAGGTLHISTSLGDVGAVYDTGGLCGLFACPQTDVRAQSPAIDVTGRGPLRVSFDYITSGQAPSDRAELVYFDGNAWSSLGLLPQTPVNCTGGRGRWARHDAVLPPPAAGSIRIGFRWFNNDDGAGVDPSVAIANLALRSDPVVTGVGVPVPGTYGVGQVLAFTATFDAPVSVDTAGGTPSLQLTIGAVSRAAVLTGAAASALTFQYVVQPGDLDADGIVVNALATGGGRIFDAATGDNAALALNGVGATTALLVDGVAPSVLSIARAGAASVPEGSQQDFVVTFNEPVTGVDAGDFVVASSGVSGAAVVSVSGAGAVYTVRVSVGSGAGSVRLDLSDDDSIRDAVNPFGGTGAQPYTGGETYTVSLAATVPGAPAAVSAAKGNGSATVSFAAPADGGSPILDYQVTASPGGIVATGAGSPVVVNGLTNGVGYTFTVRARNAIGLGPPSLPSAAVVPSTVPAAPSAVTAAKGNGSATVSFAAPADGGSPILDYEVVSSPGGITISGGSSPIVVTGLANGTPYTFTVRARNAEGFGPASAPSAVVVPSAVPGAPSAVTATKGNGSATVSFAAPADGGSPILDYEVVSSPGGITISGGSSPIVVTGLANGTPYTFTVRARNAEGFGPASAPSAAVVPSTVPGMPQALSATAGNTAITLTFSAPATDGGSPITAYQATCSPAAVTVSAAASPIVVTGLPNGVLQSCSVVAVNANGPGAASVAGAVAPSQRSYSAPSATGTGTIAASFSGGGPACSFATAQFIPLSGAPRSPPAGSAPPGVTFPHGLFDFTTTGCDAGSTLHFTVVYPANLPPGAVYWKYGPTPSRTIPHWYVLPASMGGAQASFSITDGGLGDDDLLANGAVIDQGGPGTPPPVANAIPALSEWGRMLLCLLLAMTAWWALRRQDARSWRAR